MTESIFPGVDLVDFQKITESSNFGDVDPRPEQINNRDISDDEEFEGEEIEFRNRLESLPSRKKRKLILSRLNTLEDVVKDLTNSELPDIWSDKSSYLCNCSQTNDHSAFSFIPISESTQDRSLLYQIVQQIRLFFDSKYTCQQILNEIHKCAGDVREAVISISKGNISSTKSSVLSLTSISIKGEQLERYIERSPK